MTFENELGIILSKLILSKEDRQYTKDAEEIRDILIGKMKEQDTNFAKWFDGTSLTGSYLDDLKIESSDEFDIHIKIKLPDPTKITEKPELPGILFVQAISNCQSQLTDHYENGFYISRIKVQDWLRKIFVSIFNPDILSLRLSSGRCYHVEYDRKLRGYAVAHTFKATEIYGHPDNGKREIWLDFVAAFEYNKKDWVSDKKYPAPDKPWFAVPCLMYSPSKINELTFNICAPHQELELIKDKQNLKNSLRLFKAIKDHNGLWKIKSYFIKTVYLWEIENQSDEFWHKSLGELLIFMMQRLIQYLQKRNLPFYWNSKSNLLDHIEETERQQYEQKLHVIVTKLISYKGTETNGALGKLFGF